jgi:HEPN domain-containing protein
MSAPESNYTAWLAKAESDLLNIENNLSASHVPWDTVCFHAQQAAEKLFKAFLVRHGRPLVRTHDLIALLAACAEIDPSLAGLQQDCQKLSYYAVASRYPADLYEPEEKEARQMIEAARRVRVEVLRSLGRNY